MITSFCEASMDFQNTSFIIGHAAAPPPAECATKRFAKKIFGV